MWPTDASAQWRYPYPPGYYAPRDLTAVRLLVTPREAQVYVDGYYAGIVDDYDGVFQRLHLPAGEHEIVLYLDGYRTVHQKVYLTPDDTYKLRYKMEKNLAGETSEPPPTAQGPGEAPPPVADRQRRLDLDLLAGEAGVVGRPHERAVEAGRAHLEGVGPLDRVGHVEDRRERVADVGAVLDRHDARVVHGLGQDLHGLALDAHDLDQDELETHVLEGRLDEIG